MLTVTTPAHHLTLQCTSGRNAHSPPQSLLTVVCQSQYCWAKNAKFYPEQTVRSDSLKYLSLFCKCTGLSFQNGEPFTLSKKNITFYTDNSKGPAVGKKHISS